VPHDRRLTRGRRGRKRAASGLWAVQ
jgi:hypothetical protein